MKVSKRCLLFVLILISKVSFGQYDKEYVQKILRHYIDAVGGMARLEKINTIKYQMMADQEGQQIEMEITRMLPNSHITNIKINGEDFQKVVYHEGKGYVITQGEKADMEEKALMDFGKATSLFDEVDMLNGVKEVKAYEEQELDGRKYAVLSQTIKGQDSRIYYDLETGLKYMVSSIMTGANGDFESKLYYSDYKESEGVKIPRIITQDLGVMTVPMKIVNLELNQNVTAENFK